MLKSLRWDLARTDRQFGHSAATLQEKWHDPCEWVALSGAQNAPCMALLSSETPASSPLRAEAGLAQPVTPVGLPSVSYKRGTPSCTLCAGGLSKSQPLKSWRTWLDCAVALSLTLQDDAVACWGETAGKFFEVIFHFHESVSVCVLLRSGVLGLESHFRMCR